MFASKMANKLACAYTHTRVRESVTVTVYLGSGRSSENEPFRTLDLQPEVTTLWRYRNECIIIIIIINRLPHDVRASPSLNVFKWKLKTHLFLEAFHY